MDCQQFENQGVHEPRGDRKILGDRFPAAEGQDVRIVNENLKDRDQTSR
jgi:hypothetical protein